MISYYRSKHPGLFIYLSLLSTTVLALLLLDMTPKLVGIFSIIWGSFIIMRALSLYEVSEHFHLFASHASSSKETNHRASSLAHDLNKRRSAHNHMKRGLCALNSIKTKSFLWLGLGIFYCAFYASWNYGVMHLHDIITHICIAFIIGSSFWCGQTYAYSNQASRLIIRIVSILFSITLIANFSSFDTTLTFDQTQLVLSILLAYSGLCMLYALKNNADKKLNALLGIALISALTFYSSYPLWVCGLSLFSIVWIRAYKNTNKSYILYQCE